MPIRRRKEKREEPEIRIVHGTDYYIETVLRYKTADGYTGSIVKIRSKKDI